MSDQPMSPDEAQGWLEAYRDENHPIMASHHTALTTIARMDVEEERIMAYDAHGGLHQTGKWTRLVGEWVRDE